MWAQIDGRGAERQNERRSDDNRHHHDIILAFRKR